MIDWAQFPGVRATLARWGVLPDGVAAEAVGDMLGLGVRKVIKSGGYSGSVSCWRTLRHSLPIRLSCPRHQRHGVDLVAGQERG